MRVAVVTTDVPDYALLVGVPAQRAGWACECGEVLPDFASGHLPAVPAQVRVT